MTAAAASTGASTLASAGASTESRKLRELLSAARLGAREAQYELGVMYANGAGVKRDLKEAVTWVGKAAEKGLAAAQYLLATQYATGQDDRAVHAWLTRAAEQGHARAIYRLGRLHESAQPRIAYGQMLKAAELGLAEAQCAVARALASGNGVEVDIAASRRWLRKAVDQGWAAAQHEWAVIHAEGRGVEANLTLALQWYRKAAAQDHAPALIALAALDAAGHGRRAGPEATESRLPRGMLERRRDARRWSNVADPGDAESRYCLGLMFEQGIDVAPRRGKAKSWFALAAKQGDPRAQAALGRLFESTEPEVALDWYAQAAAQDDRGAQRALARLSANRGDPAGAFDGLRWYARAADGDDPVALLTLGSLLGTSQDAAAFECFRRSARQGVAQAQLQVGRRYAAGLGVAADARLAAHWYAEAAAQGEAEAQCALGVCHLHGQGLMQSAAEAFRWFREAAAQGDAQSQWHLGALYASGGEGVSQDLRLAFAWCQKAADQGFAAARATLGLLHMRMDEPEKAFVLWIDAALGGDGEAQYNLAGLLAKGQGCERDERAAFSWFAKAAERGIAPAQSRLALMYATGEGVALDPIEAHKWFVIAARAGDEAARANRQHSESRLGAMQIDEAERRASAWNAYRQPLLAGPAVDARVG